MEMVPPLPQQRTNDSPPRNEILKNITNNAGKSPRRGKRDRERRVCDVSLDYQLECQQKTDLEKRQRTTQRRGYDIEWELPTVTVVYASKEEALATIRFKKEMREEYEKEKQAEREEIEPGQIIPGQIIEERENEFEANNSESENGFELQPDNADALKAKVGVILFPHILCSCPCSVSHSTSRSISGASATGWR
jgi:hypothetical protein